ncbi:hypothetical protein [Cryptosporangium sp. NPDC048952]|uniref:hypothetical protein n=1 Tax=Cryptosporangium sp. NPDC048952 TaxID=3363961 RepID=UPI00372125DE
MARVWTSVCAIAGLVAVGVTVASSSASGDGPAPSEKDRPLAVSTGSPQLSTKIEPDVEARPGTALRPDAEAQPRAAIPPAIEAQPRAAIPPGTEQRSGAERQSGSERGGVEKRVRKVECKPPGRIRVTVGKVGSGNRVGGRNEGSFQTGKVVIGGKVIEAEPGETVDVRVPGKCVPKAKSAPASKNR